MTLVRADLGCTVDPGDDLRCFGSVGVVLRRFRGGLEWLVYVEIILHRLTGGDNFTIDRLVQAPRALTDTHESTVCCCTFTPVRARAYVQIEGQNKTN